MSRHGTKLGTYTLHEEINSGGMSEIWLGTDPSGRPVAVRILLNNSTFAFTERRRFLTGCETLLACQDNRLIIGYIEHGKFDGELVLIIEYVEGENLKLLLTSQDPVLSEGIAQVLIDMAESLELVHDRGFMHLDFKPENVLLTRNGRLRLIDFDLARPIPVPPRKLDKNPGTPHYMSPEQLGREAVDQRADIWALESVPTNCSPPENLSPARQPTTSIALNVTVPLSKTRAQLTRPFPSAWNELSCVASNSILINATERCPWSPTNYAKNSTFNRRSLGRVSHSRFTDLTLNQSLLRLTSIEGVTKTTTALGGFHLQRIQDYSGAHTASRVWHRLTPIESLSPPARS